MHYRNGREAKNGDRVLNLDAYPAPVIGILRDAVPGNDYCNGYTQIGAEPSQNDPSACMCDCLHIDDVLAILAEKGLGKRPEGM